MAEVSEEWEDDGVYLSLATSFTGLEQENLGHQQTADPPADVGFVTSDSEPLINLTRRNEVPPADQGFITSDSEPLINLTRRNEVPPADQGFITSDSEPLINLTSRAEAPPADLGFDTSDDEALHLAILGEAQPSETDTNSRRRYKKRDRDLVRAVSISANAAQRSAYDNSVHKRRIENLLLANGLTLVEVPSDGNCFFHACSLKLSPLSSEDIRKCLCDCMEDNSGSFVDFFPFSGDRDNRFSEYMDNVRELRNPGRYSNNAGDMLPLALATWTKNIVRIYSSSVNRPIIDIHPVGTVVQQNTPVLELALLEYPNAPHYNTCTPLTGQASLVSEMPENPTAMDQASVPSVPSIHHSLPCTDADQSSPNDTVDYHLPVTPTATDHEPAPASPDNAQIDNLSQQCSPPAACCPPGVDTPRKQGNYRSPPKKVLTRKKVAEPHKWKKNVRKQLRLQGKSYMSGEGKQVPEKTVRKVDCSQCKLKCDRLMERREEIFKTFYALDSYDKQKQYVCSHLIEQNTKTLFNDEINEPVKKKRHVSRQYHLTVDGHKERVCKKFFLSTLAVSQSYVDDTVAKTHSGVYVGPQISGTRRPHNKILDANTERVKQHIAAFPTVPSHYTRKDSQRQYLASELSIKKMHDLYVEECQKESIQAVSSRQYRKIFNENYNLSFHKPKKDQCSTCTIYQMRKLEGKAGEKEEDGQKQHLFRKERAREEKEKDKQAAQKDPSKHVVTVDLQAVLQAPCTNVSQLYYKRKLSIYNFTIYSLADGQGFCYIWDETEGQRGSIEIATCIFMYLQSLPNIVKQVTIFSDCCGGQNRNQNLTAALVHAVNTIPHLQVITQKFLETGHTNMECDSMHAAISHAKKTTNVYVPSEYDIVLQFARKQKKYVVIPMKHSSFYDFKLVAQATVRNTRVDTDGRRLNWLHIKCMQVCKGQDDVMQFKTSYEEEFRTIRLAGSTKRNRPTPVKTLPLRYNEKLPISSAKHRDLMSLCHSGIIPGHHHHFFETLPVTSSARDKLPEPDVEDSSGHESE